MRISPPKISKYGKVVWTRQHIDFVKKHFHKMTAQQLADALGAKRTKTRELCYSLGLYKMRLQHWTPEQVDYLRKNYKTKGDTELAQEFTKMWAKPKGWTKKHIEKKRRYLKLKRTAAQRKAIHKRNVRLGMFAECPVKAWETRGTTPEGTIKIWDRIAVIRLEDKFVHYNRWLFEQNYFTLPSHICVVTKSGKIVAEGPEDLKIISRAENAYRNKVLPEELKPTRNLLREIERQLINN